MQQHNNFETSVLALVGKKIGMSQVFGQDGKSFAVSVVAIEPNLVVQEITKEKRGYQATALGVGKLKASRQTKTLLGQYSSLKETPRSFVVEIREMSSFKRGEFLSLEQGFFNAGDLVDVSGKTKGKGFAGAIKRHNQAIGPRSHGGGGGSKPIRQVGSLGDITGNKVFKGMKMPGRMGSEQRTIKNLMVAHVEPQLGYILIKGAIPGPNKSWVLIKKTKTHNNEFKKAKVFGPLVRNEVDFNQNQEELKSQPKNFKNESKTIATKTEKIDSNLKASTLEPIKEESIQKKDNLKPGESN